MCGVSRDVLITLPADLSAHLMRYSDNNSALQHTDADVDAAAAAPTLPPYVDAFGDIPPPNADQQPLLGLRLEFTLPPRCKHHIMRHMSHVTRHTSHVTHHMSHVTSHVMSHVTPARMRQCW